MSSGHRVDCSPSFLVEELDVRKLCTLDDAQPVDDKGRYDTAEMHKQQLANSAETKMGAIYCAESVTSDWHRYPTSNVHVHNIGKLFQLKNPYKI